jgi:uncharacterized repeat protein (TIGR02543 family)
MQKRIELVVSIKAIICNLCLLCLAFVAVIGTITIANAAAPGEIVVFAGGGVGDGGSATSVSLREPSGVAVDSVGNIYVADKANSRIRKIDTSGVISTVAGNGTASFSGDGGAATSASLNNPYAVAVDSSGNIYISDQGNQRIRKVNTSGVISTVAGNGTAGVSGDGGAATSAELYTPGGIAVDSSGNIYIVDSRRIRKVDTSGVISTVVISNLSSPIGVAVDSSGNLYIADWGWNYIKKVNTSGVVSTVAGNGTSVSSGDWGYATSAGLNEPVAVAVDAAGNIYIAEWNGQRIRKITTNGIIYTVAGTGAGGFSGDGGAATSARIYYSYGVAADSSGNIYIADSMNRRIRKVNTSGVINTVAGSGAVFFNGGGGAGGFSGDGGAATSAQLYSPSVGASDSSGNIYIADAGRIRKVTPSGIISTVAGNGTVGSAGDGGTATSAMISTAMGVAFDSSGNIYIADYSNNCIRKVSTSGVISTVAGHNDPNTFGSTGDGGPATAAYIYGPRGIAVDSTGNIYIVQEGSSLIRKVDPSGVISTFAGNRTYGYSGDGGPATAAALKFPNAVAVDSSGNVYIADTGNNRIRKVDTSGIISTIAGSDFGNYYAGDGGPATAASLYKPKGVTVDSAGNIYFADTGNNRLRKVNAAGMISTVAGNGVLGYSGDGGSATSAMINMDTFSSPSGVVIDPSGNIYISDNTNVRIRKVYPANISDAPTGVTATAGNGQATVSFEPPPSNGGSAITYYTVTSSPEGIQKTGISSPITIAGLTNCTAYTFTVTATNPMGTSAASSASNSIIPSVLPGAPVIGSATAGSALATVTFTAPALTGCGAITGYKVTSIPYSISATGTASPITITGLIPGAAYIFYVQAISAAGIGTSLSAVSNSVTPTVSFTSRTGQITSYAAGDDAALQRGGNSPSQRFTDNNDGTVTDNLTGLVWLKNADCYGKQSWDNAIASATGLDNGACGLNDGSTAGQWRLPNINELESLVNMQLSNPALSSDVFLTAQSFYYWSSSSDPNSTTDALGINMNDGLVDATGKGVAYHVWPVRTGQPTTTTAQVWKTGQTVSYAANDDGALKKGVAWPSTRFVDNYNGTVTDNLTKLVWLKNANCFGGQSWANALASSSNLANGACGLSDGSLAGDWQLPNRKELQSLVDRSRANPSLPASALTFFPNVQSDIYWSSSTYAFNTGNAWNVNMNLGYEYGAGKENLYNVWPVRAGQPGLSGPLTLTKTGSGTGTVTSNPAAISCGATCTSKFPTGQSVKLTASQGTGSTFAGWTGCGFTSGTTCTVVVGSSKNVSANFDTIMYSVTYNSNGGSDVPSQNIAYNTVATVPPAPTKAGYTFAGWYTTSGLTTAFAFTTAITANRTLYAKWTIANYNVTFNSNGGSTIIDQSVLYNSVATAPSSPIKTGYTFDGWYSDAGLATVFAFTTPISGSITLYAKWTAITYTISGNAGIAGVTLSYTDGTAKTATADASGNYSFTVFYNWSGSVTVGKSGFTFIPSNLTYANVQANQTNQDYTAKAVQSIYFGTAPTVIFGGTGTVSAIATSGLPVGLTSITPDFCSITGTTITGIKGGNCTIAANQAGDSSYNPAIQMTLSFVISKPVAGIYLGGLIFTYDGTSKRTTVTTYPAGLAYIITYAGSTAYPVNVGSYAVIATINDPGYEGIVNGTLIINPPILSVTVSGDGKGNINSNPSGITCSEGTSGTCSYAFTPGTVTLHASPSTISTFGGWTGCTPVTPTSCDVLIDGNKSVGASFTLAPKAMIGTTAYTSLGAAYLGASLSAAAGTTIKLLDTELTGDLEINGKHIILVGGYNAEFTARTGHPTFLKGKLIIKSGSLHVDGVSVR